MITLNAIFSEFKLTSNQSDLLVSLETFLSGNIPCFILKGYAGTGKTFMMEGLTKFLAAKEISFRLAAPTGRAAKIISQKTKQPAYTIHKTIYSTTDLREYKTQNLDGTETYKFFYGIRVNQDNPFTIYIIDESSMISDKYSEGEFFRFGSGYLLKDLITYIGLNNTNNRNKLILIGDNAQLPPVNMNFSPALDKDHLSKEYSINSVSFELTEIVRQKSDSGILANATNLREALRNKSFGQLMIEDSFHDISEVNPEQLLTNYMDACNAKISDDTIIIAHANATVKDYNELVREQFFPGQKLMCESDKIIVVNNNYNYEIELLNGEFGTVEWVSPANEERNVTLKAKVNESIIEENVQLYFRQTTIRFKDLQNKEHKINCKIIENLLYSSNPELSSNEQKALYIDFWIRHPKLNSIRVLLQAKNINHTKLSVLVASIGPADVNAKVLSKIKKLQEEYFAKPGVSSLTETSLSILKDALRADPYFNALRIKFGYAITCHKAQGGEWKHVFVNCKTSMGYFNAMYFRWLYTAITRAVSNLHVVNPPKFNPLSHLNPPAVENLVFKYDLLVIDETAFNQELTFCFPEGKPFSRLVYFAVTDLLKDAGVNIDAINHPDNHELYNISRGFEPVLLRIYYNKKQVITSILGPSSPSALADELIQLLLPLKNKKIISHDEIAKTENQKKDFQFEHQFLQDFYKALCIKIEGSGIKITDIESKAYHEIYTFQKDGLKATYKFHYKKNGQIKSNEVIPNRTTGLVDDINALLR